MIYKVGLVGLPNVGKSSIFNLLTSSQKSTIAHFPFSTITPIKSIIKIPDLQLDKIQDTLFSWFNTLESQKFIKKECTFELVDIAGIVPLEDNSQEKKSELGAFFLSHIRGVNLILLVVRAFKNESVLSQLNKFLEEHSELSNFSYLLGDLNTTSETILEVKLVLVTLIRSDLELISKMINKYSKDKMTFSRELELLIPLKKELIERKYIPIYLLKKYQQSTDWEKQFLDRMSLLSTKKIVFVANYGSSEESLKKLLDLKSWAKMHSFPCCSLNIEGEELYLLTDSETEREQLRKSLYLQDSSVEKLLKTMIESLGLKNFYTFKLYDSKNKTYNLSNLSWNVVPIGGESRSWFFKVNESLSDSVATIHSDLSNFFVSSKIIESEKFLKISKGSMLSNSISNVSKSYQLRGGEIVQVISSV